MFLFNIWALEADTDIHHCQETEEWHDSRDWTQINYLHPTLEHHQTQSSSVSCFYRESGESCNVWEWQRRAGISRHYQDVICTNDKIIMMPNIYIRHAQINCLPEQLQLWSAMLVNVSVGTWCNPLLQIQTSFNQLNSMIFDNQEFVC